MTPGRSQALVIAAAVGLLAAPAVAGAQEVGSAADDLRDNDVTFEDGALTQRELDDVDATTARLQGTDGYLKVVVLAERVSDFGGADDYADAVRDELGGRGRVLVISPDEVAVASNVDPGDETRAAERVAADKLNAGGSLATAVSNAAGALGIAGGSTTGSAGDGGGGGGGGFPWGLVLLFAVPLLLLVVFLWWTARKQRQRAAALAEADLGAGAARVRAAVDEVANGLLELSDRVDRPDTSPEARESFRQAAELFTTTQERLEQADTPAELEAVYPEVVEARWHIATTRALLDGQPPPPKPEPEELFPRPQYPVDVPAGAGGGNGSGPPVDGSPRPAPAPEPGYRRPDLSPWLTAAAMAAMAMLSNRGMSVPRTRPAMDDDVFGSWVGGLPAGPSSNGRARPRAAGRGRSAPMRRPSSSRRGMGRR